MQFLPHHPYDYDSNPSFCFSLVVSFTVQILNKRRTKHRDSGKQNEHTHSNEAIACLTASFTNCSKIQLVINLCTNTCYTDLMLIAVHTIRLMDDGGENGASWNHFVFPWFPWWCSIATRYLYYKPKRIKSK